MYVDVLEIVGVLLLLRAEETNANAVGVRVDDLQRQRLDGALHDDLKRHFAIGRLLEHRLSTIDEKYQTIFVATSNKLQNKFHLEINKTNNKQLNNNLT